MNVQYVQSIQKEGKGMEQKKRCMGRRDLCNYLLIFVLITVITIVIVTYGTLIETTAHHPGLFLASGFMVAFAVWFGWRGVIAAFLGCFVGSGLYMGLSPDINALYSLADVLLAGIPALMFRILKANPDLRRIRDIVVYVIFGLVINTFVSAVWSIESMSRGGYIPLEEVVPFIINWMAGDIFIIFTITSVLLSFGTPMLRKRGLIPQHF